MATMTAILDFRSPPIFDLQVTLMLPTKFGVNWPFGSGDEVKIDFQDGGHLGFPIGTILAIFDLQVTPMLPTDFRVNWHLGLGGEAKKKEIFKKAAMAAILDL